MKTNSHTQPTCLLSWQTEGRRHGRLTVGPQGPGGCLGKGGAASIHGLPRSQFSHRHFSLFSLGKIVIKLITLTQKKKKSENRGDKKGDQLNANIFRMLL